MRPETPAWGVGRLLRLLRTRAFVYSGFCVPGERLCSGCSAHFCARAVFLGLRCADAGHPPGLFAE